MSLLTILRYPDPRLNKVAKPVAAVDARIRTLIDDMFETMYDAPGIGLAAIQIGVPLRVVTIDLSKPEAKEGEEPAHPLAAVFGAAPGPQVYLIGKHRPPI